MTAIKPYWIECYRMVGDGVQAPGAIVLRAIPNHDHPFVVHFWNEQHNGYSDGYYCKTLKDAMEAYEKRCKRYDPTGQLHIGWLTKQLEFRTRTQAS